MDIILIQDVDNLGAAHEKVSVKHGYARNYLIPRRKAIQSVGNAQAVFKDRERARVALEQKQRQSAQSLRDRMAQASLQFSVQVGDEDQLYGSVTAGEIQPPPSPAVTTRWVPQAVLALVLPFLAVVLFTLV